MQKWSVRHGVLSSLGPAALVLIKPPCPTLHCCITSQNTNVRLARSCVMKNINNRLWYACVEHKLSRWIGYNTRSEIREGSVTMIFWPVGHIGVTWSKWSIQIWPWQSVKLPNFHGQNDQSKSDHDYFYNSRLFCYWNLLKYLLIVTILPWPFLDKNGYSHDHLENLRVPCSWSNPPPHIIPHWAIAI